MKVIIKSLMFCVLLIMVVNANAQDAVKNVFVETYYVSDENDATDTLGGGLAAGSVTYRIYVQLRPGCKLLSIFGEDGHTLEFSSTESFFNNLDFGRTFAKDFNKSNYSKNTVALDSWLTLGQTTKKSALTYFGIPKSQDSNGSIIGGLNNDGGSAEVTSGLLTNNDPLAGIPLTTADGMDTLHDVESNWVSHGFIDEISGEDSTIFGSFAKSSSFVSSNAFLSNSGVRGIDPEDNQVLVAQLTTKGKLSFKLNLQVFDPQADQSFRSLYVAEGVDSIDLNNHSIIKVSPFLKYPQECGCTDPNFMEFDTKYACNDEDQCKTRIILGCMDRSACNYNPDANYNVVDLCCYPGFCADRDISFACPSNGEAVLRLDVYPNPASNQITIKTDEVSTSTEVKYMIYNYYGNLQVEKKLGSINGKIEDVLDVSTFNPGIYLVKIIAGDATDSRMFIKN